MVSTLDSIQDLLPEISKSGATQTRGRHTSRQFPNQNKFYPPAKLVQIEMPACRPKIELTQSEKHERLLDRLKISTKLHTMQEVG
jgi:predicted peroxiredoxin